MKVKPNKLNHDEILKLDLNCIYPVSDMIKAAGAGKYSFQKLKRQGLDARWFAGRQWARAIDVWNMMKPVKVTEKIEEISQEEVDESIEQHFENPVSHEDLPNS